MSGSFLLSRNITAASEERNAAPRTAPTEAPTTTVLSFGQAVGVGKEVGIGEDVGLSVLEGDVSVDVVEDVRPS